MSIDPGPHDLNKMLYILGADGSGTLKADSPDFYQELDTEFDGFAGRTLISRFSFDEPWPTWEMHPKGDEFVYLLEGDTDLILLQDGEETAVRIHVPGDYVASASGMTQTKGITAPATRVEVRA